MKFYLYSDFETRVKRLWNESYRVDIEEIRKNLIIRDNIEMDDESFVKPKNAIEIDSTDKNIDEVFQIMMK